MKQLVIIGAGGHGRVCAEAATAAGYPVAAFCDMAGGAAIGGLKVYKAATIKEVADIFDSADFGLLVAIGGDNETRMQQLTEAETLGFALPVVIHPSAVISPSAVIGAGTVVIANSVVNADSRVGKGCILNTACSIDHDNFLGDGVQICPGVRSAGNVTFGEKSFIGTGTVLVPSVKIGARAYVAAGALITRDVADDERVSSNSGGRRPGQLIPALGPLYD